jgi:hypothetical protein
VGVPIAPDSAALPSDRVPVDGPIGTLVESDTAAGHQVIVNPQFYFTVAQTATASPTVMQQSHQEGVSGMGDVNMPKGVSVGVGRKAVGVVNELHQVWNELGDGEIDLLVLAADLSTVRAQMRAEASSPENDIAIAEVAQAEIAAKADDGPGALEHLRRAGKWTLDVATRAGAGVAATAAAVALGISLK